MMIVPRLVHALLVASVVYLTGALFFSAYNTAAYEELEHHAERLSANVTELRERNRELIAQADLYRRSPDAVAVAARSLQYYEPGHEVIRVPDASTRSRAQSPGTIVRRPVQVADHMPYVRLAAIAAFLATLAVELILASSGSVRRAERPHEIPRASR